MTILLVYPKMPVTYWSFDHAIAFVGKRASLPPLGLITVAALLPEEFEVRLIDMNVTGLAPEDVDSADLVFISAMIIQAESFQDVVRLCNERDTPVVAGGPYPISNHENIKGVDHFVLDEAELTLPKFLDDLAAGDPQRIYRDPAKPDLTRTPPPRFDLLDIGAYNSMAVQYSRGCPYCCEFCDIIEMFGRKQRTKLPAQFLGELDAILATGFRGSVFVVDDNFVGNRQKTRRLVAAVNDWQAAHGYPFSLYTEASIDLAGDDELLDLMQSAGFIMVFVGVETPDTHTLEFVHKAQNTKLDLHASIRRIQEHGMEVTGGFIIGFDTDDEGIFDRQIEFIQHAGIPTAMVGLLLALPNTALHRRLASEGRLLGETTGNNTHSLSLNFVPRLPEHVLVEGYKRVLADLYTPARYFERCRILLSRMPNRRRRGMVVTGSEIRAFFLSLIKQTFSSYGLQYLRFILGTLVRRIHLFPLAVVLAIQGYHLIKITAEIGRADAFSRRLERTQRLVRSRVQRALRFRRRNKTAELHIRKIEARFRLRYEDFGEDMQRYLEQTFAAFLERCNTWRGLLRRMRSMG